MQRGQNASVRERELRWLNNRWLMRYSEQSGKLHTIESQQAYIASFNYPDTLWNIYLKTDQPPPSERFEYGAFIGSMSATVDRTGIADVGILLGDEIPHGQGLGFEAWKGLCDYLLSLPHIRKIEAGCMEPNEAMKRICHKYGMQLEGRRKYHFAFGDTFVDMMLYGKLK